MGPSELLEHVVAVFERLGIPYLVTGSVAAMAYGEPRLTNDIDIVAGITERHIPGLLEAFPAADYYLYEAAVRDAIRRPGQFNIIHPASGLKIDVIIRRDTAFDHSRFGRIRRIHPAENFEADFAAPEDVIIKKMEYYREGGSEKHLRDITGILLTSASDVDRPYIEHWAQQLGLSEIWEAIEKRLRT
ncbi:MAG: nucleotidyltransferase family protein [Candidatus Geothermincolia bacterium]